MKGNRLAPREPPAGSAPSGQDAGAPPPSGVLSIAAVARRAGVSTATVSRIVNGVTNRAAPETVARVLKVVAEVGYRPSGAGQALRRRESRLVAVIASNLANPAMAAIAASVEAALRDGGKVMVICDSHDRADLQDEYLREMKAHAVRGFVLLGAVRSPVLEAMVAAGDPVIFVNRASPYPQPAPFVGIDNRRAGQQIAEMFARDGVRRAAVIHGALTSSATQHRVDAFREAHQRLTGKAAAIIGDPGTDHLDLGYRTMTALRARGADGPDAVFCLSDLIAYGAMRALRESPAATRPCRIVGFDDSPLNDWIAPDLTSVRVPYESFGPAILRALGAVWDGQTAISAILDHRLVIRPTRVD